MRLLGNRTLTVHEAVSQGRYHLGAPTFLLRYKTASFLSEGLACSKQMFSSCALTNEVLVDQIATSSGLSTFLELFVSSGSLYRCASADTNAISLPKLFVVSLHRMNCVIWVHTGAYPLPFSLEEQKTRKHLLRDSMGQLQLFSREWPLGQPYLILRHNHNGKGMTHLESKASSAWLRL